MLERLKSWARLIKTDVVALWLAARRPETPWYAKAVAAAVAAYARSPIDLIPDFIPVLGYLDDLLIVPAGIILAVKLIPPDVMLACRAEASRIVSRPTSKAGAVAIGIVWLIAFLAAWWLRRAR